MIQSLIIYFAFALAPQGDQDFPDVTVELGGSAVSFVGRYVLPEVDGSGSKSGQTLRTSIDDPDNPDEPWEVTTYRRPGESVHSFIGRHRDMVTSVREALEN